MNVTINLLGNRLQTLMGNVNFKSDFDKALDSPEYLMAIGEHNIREYYKLEAMGKEHCERIQNLFANMLASAPQKEAIEKRGNTDRSSIRQVLNGWFNRPEDRVFEDRLRQTTQRGLLDFNLTKDQCQAILTGIFDELPQVIMEAIEQLIASMRLLPRAEAQSVVMALADIMKEEVKNAKSQRHN